MTAIVLRGDARHLPLPDGCVDLIVTSPPYFGLRSYTDGGEHYSGQIGGEATPQEWLAALQECTRDWIRVRDMPKPPPVPEGMEPLFEMGGAS